MDLDSFGRKLALVGAVAAVSATAQAVVDGVDVTLAFQSNVSAVGMIIGFIGMILSSVRTKQRN